MTTAASPAQSAGPVRRLLRDPVATGALLLVLLLVAGAALAPLIAPTDAADNDLSAMMAPPGGEHLLGADDQGRDMVTRLLFGLRLTLLTGLAAVLLGGSVGAALGFLAALFPSADQPVMRAMDVLLSFPAILFGLAFAAIMGPGVPAVVAALSVATLPLTARIARAAAGVEMARDYVEAARAVGAGTGRLVWRHLAPNCLSPLLVFATLRFGQVVLLGSLLSFLGLGAQPPTAELGAMAAAGRSFLFYAPHVAALPCALIFVIVLAFNLLGDALRDLLDPRLRV